MNQTQGTLIDSSKVDDAIGKVLGKLSNTEPGTKEYAALADQLTKLYRLKEMEVQLKLKELDFHNKEAESIKNLELKEKESEARQAESAINAEVRRTEILHKAKELDVSTKLKEIEIQLKEKDLETHGRVSKETLALIAANLAGIVVVLGYERANVIASKAFGFITKLR